MRPTTVTMGCATCGETPGKAEGYVCKCYSTEKLDERDAEILVERFSKLNELAGPRVGDYIRFVDGVEHRASFVTPIEWLPECDSVQTSEGGSWYLGDGYMSFSGGLHPGVSRSTLTLSTETKLGSCWFFHHDYAQKNNGIDVQIPFRVYECSAARTL